MDQAKRLIVALFFLSFPCLLMGQQESNPAMDYENELNRAVIDGNVKKAKELILAGKGNNNSALSYAVAWNRKEVVDLLFSKDVDPNVSAGYISLPLIIACEKNNVNMAKALLARGAEPNVSNSNGESPLHIAAKQGNLELVKNLVAAGADIQRPFPTWAIGNASTEGKKSAVEIARENNHREVAEYLGSALAGLESDALFYPVQNGYLILPKTCSLEEKLNWSPDLEKVVPGLKPGARVSGFTEDGTKIEQATLANLSCVEGECRENYVGIKIEGWDQSKRFGIVWKSGLPATISWLSQEDTTASGCQPLPKFSKTYEEQLEQKCSRYQSKAGPKGNFFVEIASKGEMQENGWPIYQAFAHVTWDEFSGAKKTTPWKALGADTSIERPWLISVSKNSDPRLVFVNFSGICCPAGGTVRELKVEKSGTLREGRIFSAGGQPCD